MNKLFIDSFAGGGGASTGIEAAIGKSPDIAINHDREAIAMHMKNHPETRHLCESVFSVDLAKHCRGRKVAGLWASPDCRHFSRAKGGAPNRSKEIRGLASVIPDYIDQVRPERIFLENVIEFLTWGPLDSSGRPIKRFEGIAFRAWVRKLKARGYKVEWRKLRASYYGAPTIRERLFIIARCDGEPIVWPEPTHGPTDSLEVAAGLRKPERPVAECINWSIPCPSIFEREKPLAEATLRRIARGIEKYVINAARPFIVPVTHQGDNRVYDIDRPARTVTGAQRGEMALVTAHVSTYYGSSRAGGELRASGMAEPLRRQTTENRHALVTGSIIKLQLGGQAIEEPLHTVMAGAPRFGVVAAHISRQFGEGVGSAADSPIGATTAGGGGKSALISAFMAQNNGGFAKDNAGRAVWDPISTILGSGANQSITAAHLTHFYGSGPGEGDPRAPARTITAGGFHAGVVETALARFPIAADHSADVADLLYLYGSDAPKEFSLSVYRRIRCNYRTATKGVVSPPGPVLVEIDGLTYAMTDIGMRMLAPRELFLAQGFPEDYVIDFEFNGKPLTKTAQIRMCGNSVCPDVAEALVAANFSELFELQQAV